MKTYAEYDGAICFEFLHNLKNLNIYLEADGLSFDVVRSDSLDKNITTYSLDSLIEHWNWLNE